MPTLWKFSMQVLALFKAYHGGHDRVLVVQVSWSCNNGVPGMFNASVANSHRG